MPKRRASPKTRESESSSLAPTTGQGWYDLGWCQADDQIEGGFADPLELLVEKRKELALLEGTIARLLEAAREQAYRLSGTSFRVAGATIKKTVTGSRVPWDSEPEAVRLTQQLADWKRTILSLEEPGIVITCEGEEYHAKPLRAVGGTETISITIEPDSQ